MEMWEQARGAAVAQSERERESSLLDEKDAVVDPGTRSQRVVESLG